MTTYDATKSMLIESKTMQNGVPCHIVSSAVAAAAACVAMQPFDLIGSRMMNQPVSADGKPVLYSSPVECFTKTIQAEGPGGLYKGVFANYVRMGPQYILTFVFFEQFMKILKDRREGQKK